MLGRGRGRVTRVRANAAIEVPTFMMFRFSARVLAMSGALLLAVGGAALWLSVDRGEAVAAASLPPPAAPATPQMASLADDLPSPDPKRQKTKEEQRFARADRDDDGRITQTEYLHQRRRNFDKLDTNGDGKLGFEEYAVAGIAKFQKADANRDGVLLAGEFVTTAPKPRKAASASAANCRCPAPAALASLED